MVEVDVFEITDEALPGRLDNYEGYPSLYNRERVPTEDGQEVWVYTYNHPVSEESRIETGRWE
jgi:gamma-glutamylcyclotransferase (GGCT)/AIG2-like uncharacterized protein YtfP